ncbi:ATP-binding protein [Anaeromyxobacter oryzisoli]|uniref:ATP-binding protein n=1 Tax=Anaeromyxobacter oryzisoli TaxID=2925408 RepID=UPI001F59A40B|nr:ATP-binding protein [Anaeromyxobacter sp. SG63]
MSLRTRIILLFAATLVCTLGVAAYLGEQVASRVIERSLRDRTADVARAIAEELDLSPRTDIEDAASSLETQLLRRRGIRSAELAIRKGSQVKVARVTMGQDGPETSLETLSSRAFAVETTVTRVEFAQGRGWRVDHPLHDNPRHIFGSLRIESNLSEVEEIAATERNIFFVVAGAGAPLVALLFSLMLGRMLARPLSQLAASVERVESGSLDLAAVPGVERHDEIGVLARGLAAMLARVRRVNSNLKSMIEDATADLAHKNRELAEVNELLVEARRDLTSKERLATLGQLSGTIAHELGNPLNTISGHVQLLARDPACPEALRPGLQALEGEVKRMTGIIRRFLDSARALTPEPEPVDVAGLLDDVLGLSVPIGVRSRIELVRDVPEDLGEVRLDPSLVRHVLSNLVSNAVDAMSGAGRLAVGAVRRNGYLGLWVKDTGPGLGPEERKRIFEPFYTTKPRGKGTGLGLAISREIANALKGRIEVESEPGAGATFTLWIPAVAERPAAEGRDATLTVPGPGRR